MTVVRRKVIVEGVTRMLDCVATSGSFLPRILIYHLSWILRRLYRPFLTFAHLKFGESAIVGVDTGVGITILNLIQSSRWKVVSRHLMVIVDISNVGVTAQVRMVNCRDLMLVVVLVTRCSPISLRRPRPLDFTSFLRVDSFILLLPHGSSLAVILSHGSNR